MAKTLAYGTITVGADEGASRPACGAAPVVDVILDRLQPSLSLAPPVGGSGATFSVALSPVGTTSGAETWGVSAVGVGGGGGSGYTDGARLSVAVSGRIVEEVAADIFLNVVDGVVESVTVDNSGEYYMTGGVESVDLVYGGAFYPSPACEYSWKGCQACVADGIRSDLKITFTAGADEHSLVGAIGEGVVFHAVQSADGGSFESLEIAPGSFFPGVSSISVTDGGSGYTSAPAVAITGSGEGASATASVLGYVDSLTLKNGGTNYWTQPTVTISGGGGSGATASAAVSFGQVVSVYLNSGGSGYTSAPTVTISGGGGSGATAVATVRQVVESVTVTSSGIGYREVPTIAFSGGGGSGAKATASLERTPAGCHETGTASLTTAACQDETERDLCRLPEQITLTVAGIEPILEWRSINGGSPGMSGWGFGNAFDGKCQPEDGVRVQTGGVAVGAAGYSLKQPVDNAVIVLDRQPGCDAIYRGVFPNLPQAGGNVATGFGVDCEGHVGGNVEVTLSPVALYANVSISSPTKGAFLQAATADVTKISSGAVAEVTLTSGGDGYAAEIINRIEPTISASVASGTGSGSTLSVSLSPLSTTAGEETWTIDSISVTSPGSGYLPSDSVALNLDEIEENSPLFAVVVLDRVEPTISVSAPGGSATLTATLTSVLDQSGDEVWEIGSVSIDTTGGDYTADGFLAFAVDDGIEVEQASGAFTVERAEPVVACNITSGTGDGAVLSVSLTQSGNDWYVSSVAVADGGSGYDDNDAVQFTCTSGVEVLPAYGYATFSGGVLTDVTLYSGGAYYDTTGNIEAATIEYAGKYYATTGAIQRVDVIDGGSYHENFRTGEIDADTPVVSFGSNTGQGATATATVDTDLESPTFGQVTAISLTSGGSGYASSGYGWKATVSVQSLIHRGGEELCEELAEYAVNESERIVMAHCPNDLLSRSYKMAYRSTTRFYGDIDNAGDAAYCFSGYYLNTLTIADFGSGDITCTLAPA